MEPIVPLVVVGTALLFGASAAAKAKKKKAAAKKKAAENGNGNGNGKKHDLPDVDPSDDPDERCPEGWFLDDDNNVICQPVAEDPADVDVEPTDIYWSTDCQTVIEGDDWFEEVFVPTALQWLDYDLEAFGYTPYLLRQLLLLPNEDGEIYSEPACIAEWPGIKAIYLDVPGGLWDESSFDGFDNWLNAVEKYIADYPAMEAWLDSLHERLWDHPEVGIILSEWWELYVDADWTFNPPCGGEGEIACAVVGG
jgi:hypothetical protein